MLRNLDAVTLGVRIPGDLGRLKPPCGYTLRLVSLIFFVLTQRPVDSRLGAQPVGLWNLRARVGLVGTAVATSSELKHNPRGSEVARACLLGDTFHVEVLSWFLAHLSVRLGSSCNPLVPES